MQLLVSFNTWVYVVVLIKLYLKGVQKPLNPSLVAELFARIMLTKGTEQLWAMRRESQGFLLVD